MLFLVLGVFFFGLTHPVGALLLKEHHSPLMFSFIYILTRTLIQLPLVGSQIRKLSLSPTQIKLILASGLVGTFLHWSEFQSLKTSIPVSQITFITFCFPIWIFIVESVRQGKVQVEGLYRFVLAITGLLLILPGEVRLTLFNSSYLYPLTSSFLLASWIMVSKKAQDTDLHPFVYSFFYDLTSLLGITGLIVSQGMSDLDGLVAFTAQTMDLNIFLYALIVGVMPNILIFKGLRQTAPITAAIIMMFEPFISSFCASILFNEAFSPVFLVGACLIFAANLPKEVTLWLGQAVRNGK